MVNFRFSSTIQSIGDGGIWVGSCFNWWCWWWQSTKM